MVLDMFQCRNQNNVYFVGMYLFLLPKTHSAGYRNCSVVVCIPTATFKGTKLTLPKRSEHQTAEQFQGSANRGEPDLNSDVNRPYSGKLRQ